MEKFNETHIIEYGCGCKHEIGLIVGGGGVWRATNKEDNCIQH